MTKKTFLLLGGLTILALLLRLLAAYRYGDFLWDEIFSFTYSQRPWSESLRLWILETNPPLHLALLKIWWYLAPPTEFFARLPSIIFGVASVPLLYALGRRLYGESAGLASAALLTLLPYHIFISVTARGYALFCFLIILALYYFVRVFIEGNSPPAFRALYSLSILLLLYTHLTAASFLASQFVFLLLAKQTALRLWLKLTALPAALWLVWAVPATLAKLHSAGFFTTAWFFLLKFNWSGVIDSIQPLLFGPMYRWHTALILFVFLGALGIVLRRQLKARQFELPLLFLLVHLVVPLVPVIALNLWNVKFIFLALPALLLTIAYLFFQLIGARPWVFAATALLLTLPGLVSLHNLLPLNNWKKINRYATERYNPNHQQIFIYTHYIYRLLFDRYYRGPIPALAYTPPELRNWDYWLIADNYHQYQHPESELAGWLVENKIFNYPEIIIMQENDAFLPVDFTALFNRAGYRLAESAIPPLSDKKKLLRYVKP